MKPYVRYMICGLFAAGTVVTGCAPPSVGFAALGSHTLRVAADQDADVVWVLKAEGDMNTAKQTVLRCTNTPQGPVCTPARVGQ
jgi:hypothetical protein